MRWICLAVAMGLPPLWATHLQGGSPEGDSPTILVDAVHANDFSLLGLRPHVYSYHQNQGFRRGFEYLEARGFRRDLFVDGRLTPERLSGRRLLFLNLVSAERPPLLVSEIATIRQYVNSGGSLLVITDHSNCYYHAYRLQPLFVELGLETFTATACEEPPLTIGGGYGWIAVRRFERHPLTIDLDCLAMQTGGCVDPRYAVAWTSERAWADAWRAGLYGEDNAPGFYGNFSRDVGEHAGPLGVVLARDFGEGRIVVVADQNIFGDVFIHYADNYRLWLNAMAWLLRDDSLRSFAAYERSRSPKVLFYERPDRAAFGADNSQGYYYAMAFLNRYYWTFANDRLSDGADLIVFARNDEPMEANDIQTLAEHLRRGGHVLILSDGASSPADPEGIVRQVSAAVGQVQATSDHGPLLRLDSGGTVAILPNDLCVRNQSMAPPSDPPNEKEKQREGRLLKVLERLLPASASSPAPSGQTHD